MRALIADDEAPARSKVRRLLEAAPDVEIVGEASTGREAVAAIKRSRPDIVFLDIQMPGIDGFGVVDAVEGDGPYIVFVTADDTKALRAFEVGAVDYLLKPFTPERFSQVLDRARGRLAAPTSANGPLLERAPLKRLLVSNNGRAVFLAVERIDRIESERNYVVIHVGRDAYRLRAPIGSIASRLDPAQFLRANRSTLVRLDAVREMHEWSHGDYRVVMQDGTELIWSRRYRAAAEREFGLE
ncbi:MAG: LytR/AlgR family response regulator transcription factor [Gemmatimonadaceae bacterium]